MQEQTLDTSNMQREPFEGFDAYIAEWLREWKVPGLALSIIKNDALVFAKGYGTRKLGEQWPVNERTVFGVASVTKAFTAATVATLVDEGEVRWDDPVIKHLPDFQLYDPYVTRELTVRDLLCARSGLVGGDVMRFGEEGYDRAEVVRRLRYLKPEVGFRAAQGSYTFMFLVAGQLVAAVTGKSWDDDETFYGKAAIRLEDDHLVFHYGLLVADLEHWHYDTFKATWRPPFYGIDLVTFALDNQTRVDDMKVTDFADFKRIH